MKLFIILCSLLVCVNAFGKEIQEKFYWYPLDYDFENFFVRILYLLNADYYPLLNTPLAIEFWKEKLFIGVHRLRHFPDAPTVVPYTLNYINSSDPRKGAPLKPYPSWDLNQPIGDNLYSVIALDTDACDRLWVVDQTQFTRHFQIVVIDLHNNTIVKKHNLTEQEQFHFISGALKVDVDKKNCNNAYAYISLMAYATNDYALDLLVYNLEADKSWKFSRKVVQQNGSGFKHYDESTVHRRVFRTQLSGIALSDRTTHDVHRTLFLQPFSDSYIFTISTKVLQNPNTTSTEKVPYKLLGFRGVGNESSYLHFDDKSGILFYDISGKNAIGCWNSRKYPKEFSPYTVAVIEVDKMLDNVFAMKADESRNLWIGTHREKSSNIYDTRIFKAGIKDLIAGSKCE